MATQTASIAASKLLNLRNPALQSLIRRQLLHPVAASPALPDPQLLDLFHLKNSSIADSNPPTHCSSDPRILPLNLQWRFGFSPVKIEAARTYVPMEGEVYHDFDEDEDDDDDEDEDEDDVDIQDYSGSDFDDEDDDK